MILKLALRNLTRNRGRLALNVGLVVIASSLLVFAVGQIGGVKQTLRQSVTDTLTGHLQVKPRQAPVDFFQHFVQVGDALSLAQQIKLADHHRPDDAVLPRAAAEIGGRAQIGRVDLVVVAVGRRQ